MDICCTVVLKSQCHDPHSVNCAVNIKIPNKLLVMSHMVAKILVLHARNIRCIKIHNRPDGGSYEVPRYFLW